MSTTLGKAYVQIIPSMEGVAGKITSELGGIDTSRAGRSMGGSLSSGFTSALSGVVSGVQTVCGGITAAVGGIAVSGGINRALQIEQATNKLQGLGHTSEDTTEIMNNALASVKGTAYGLGDAATVAATMSAAGIKSGEEMTSVLSTIGDVAQISGRSYTDMGNIFSQVAAKGKLQGDEMLQLTSAGIPVLDMLSKHFGKTREEVQDMVSHGQVDFANFSAAMQENMGGAALKAGDTFTGALANVKAALGRIGANFATPALDGLRQIFNALIPVIDSCASALKPFTDALSGQLAAWVPKITEFLGQLKEKIDGLGEGGFTNLSMGAKLAAGAFAMFASGGILSILSQVPILGGALSGLLGNFKLLTNPIATISGAFGALKGKFGELAMVASKAGGGFTGIKAAIGSLISPIGIVVAVIAVLAAAFIYLWNTNEQFKSAITGFVSLIQSSMQPAIESVSTAFSSMAETLAPVLSSLFSQIMSVIGQIITTIFQLVAVLAPVMATIISTVVPVITQIITLVVQVAAQIISALLPVVSMVISAISQIIMALTPLMPPIMQIIQVVMQLVTSIIAALMPVIQVIISCIMQIVPIVTLIVQVITQVVTAIIAIVVPIITQIADLIQAVMPTIQAIFQTVCTYIGAVVQAVFPVIQAVITTVMNIIQSVINIVLSAIKGDWSGVWNGIKSLASSVWNGIKSIISAAINAVQGVISAALDMISGIWNSIWSGISSFVSSTWSNVCSAVSDGVGNVISFVQEMPGKIQGFFSDAGSWLVSAGKDCIQGLINGISDAAGWLWDKVSGLGGDLIEHAKSALGIGSPSKLFREQVGRWIPAGIGVGIEKYSSGAMSAMGTLCDDLLGAGDDAMAEMPFASGGVNSSVNSYSRAELDVNRDSQTAEIISMLADYLPGIANQQLVLDTGVVAGAMTKKMDRNLGELQKRRAGALC